jgi:hypothetical protein
LKLIEVIKKLTKVTLLVTIVIKKSHCTVDKKPLDSSSKNLRFELLLNIGCGVEKDNDSNEPSYC